MQEENKIPLLAIAILIVFLLLISACTKQHKPAFKLPNKTYVLEQAITYPEERNVLIAVPIIPVEVDTIE